MASGNCGAPTQSLGMSNGHGGESMSKVVAQYTVDARLHAIFEQSGESGRSFDYSESVRRTLPQSVPEQQITTYLLKIQHGGHVQPFGCTLAINEPALRLIAFSANATDLLDLSPSSMPTLDSAPILGLDVDLHTLFKLIRERR